LKLELESKIADEDREILERLKESDVNIDYSSFEKKNNQPNDIGDNQDLTTCPKCGFKF
jgi:hypothetical protein